MPTHLGSVTTIRFERSPEAHKMHVDFAVASGQVVHEADPVILSAVGDIQAAGSGASAETLLGIAMTEGVALSRVTVSLKGYCDVYGESSQNALPAGPIELGAWNGTTGRREFTAASTAAKTCGHAIIPGTLDGDEIRVILLL